MIIIKIRKKCLDAEGKKNHEKKDNINIKCFFFNLKKKEIESKIRFYFPTLSKTYLFFLLLQIFVIFYANFGTHKWL